MDAESFSILWKALVGGVVTVGGILTAAVGTLYRVHLKSVEQGRKALLDQIEDLQKRVNQCNRDLENAKQDFLGRLKDKDDRIAYLESKLLEIHTTFQRMKNNG